MVTNMRRLLHVQATQKINGASEIEAVHVHDQIHSAPTTPIRTAIEKLWSVSNKLVLAPVNICVPTLRCLSLDRDEGRITLCMDGHARYQLTCRQCAPAMQLGFINPWHFATSAQSYSAFKESLLLNTIKHEMYAVTGNTYYAHIRYSVVANVAKNAPARGAFGAKFH
jgi:hypothetical protein